LSCVSTQYDLSSLGQVNQNLRPDAKLRGSNSAGASSILFVAHAGPASLGVGDLLRRLGLADGHR
jgi:hypothetical protein